VTVVWHRSDERVDRHSKEAALAVQRALDGGSMAIPDAPILICLLGGFRLVKAGHPVTVRSGGKVQALLGSLALAADWGVARDRLLDQLWPEEDPIRAGRSLNTLVYEVHRQLGDGMDAMPVAVDAGTYRLNAAAGVAVDFRRFDDLIGRGRAAARSGNDLAATSAFEQATVIYRGDLVGDSISAVVERERLRSAFLNALARLADYAFSTADYGRALEHAFRILHHDACREDAHRLAMRCFVRRGERAQALRQFDLCQRLLGTEMGASPEPETIELYRLVRGNPALV
jgi:DNA-binding SARP family transcriptional activator